MHHYRTSAGILAAIAMGWFASPAGAAPAPLTVVELFTSQGCSSCPPANANLIKLSERANVLPLSFAVTYWDYLGWKDSFDKPEFTDRQISYEPGLGKPGPYTPQMVINGATTAVGNNLGEVEQLLDKAPPLAGPSISIDQTHVSIGEGNPTAAGADVWLVRYDPNIVDVPVGRGENAGNTLPHTHVVHELVRLGAWKGTALAFNLPTGGAAWRTAILVQTVRGGPILSAASD